jgi:Glyoxalase-like domain
VEHVQWTSVVLDCSDPLRLATFWSELLDAERTRISDSYYVVRSGTMWLGAMRTGDTMPPTWPGGDRPKQIHLDLAVTDLEAAVVETLRLGATQERDQPAPGRWRDMRDPAGHLFCLSDHIHEYLPIDLSPGRS